MGYDTRFTLTWERGCASLDEVIATTIEDNEEMAYCLDAQGCPADRGRWYEHEKDMRALSTKLPFLRFCLEGEGEDGDHWIKYFLGGKMQVCKAKFVFPPFDATLLK